MKMEQTKPHAKKALAFLAIIVSLLAACLLAGCSSSSSQEKVELEIYAANSLTDAMNEAQEAYTKENPNVTFKDSQYEASGTLVQKIEAGGAPDIFISANKKNMDKVVEDGKIGEDKPFDLFANDLVIVTAEDSDIDELDLAQACDGSYTISVGDKNVPAGTYAKQALYTVGCYTNESGTDGEITGPIKGKVTEADKVGSVCSYAQSGEVDLGFVYMSAPIASLFLVFPITFFTGFWLNRNVAFRASPLGTRTQLLRYALSVAGAILLNYLCMKLFVEVVGIWPTPAKLATSLLSAAYSFLAARYFTFRGAIED